MSFLLIGGHAVNVYGLSRQTGDLDLLIPLTSKGGWLELLGKAGYSKEQDDDRFLRFRSTDLAAWPIDLMLVDDGTFEKLYRDSQEAVLGVATVRVVSARHLVTLKIHALKHYQEHRFLKDYNDILGLLRLDQTNISDEDLRELCVRYADIALFEKILRER
ncbi:MAG: hypothetical protein KDD60_04770 [Bdellovibrionales bacterium]|nr:hypothetical protein [Bdellovibrionales bacterium]